VRLDIRVGDRLVTEACEYLFEERRDNWLDFRDARSAERLTLTDAEVAVRVAEGQARLIRSFVSFSGAETIATRRADFSTLPDGEREAAKRRLAYAEAAAELPRPLCDKILRKVIEETARRIEDPVPPSPRHVRRLLQRGGDRPVASMFAARNAQKGNRTDRLDPRVRDIIEKRIDGNYMRREEITIATLCDLIRGEIDKLNDAHNLALEQPSWVTVNRAVLARDPYEVMTARKGRAAADQKFGGVQTRKDPTRPLEVVELDHTPCDLFVICEQTGLPIGRPTIVIALDRASRYPLGLHVGFDPPSVHTVMQCLRNAMLPKTYLEQKVARGEWKIKHPWIAYGKPRMLSIDRALENIGGDLEDFAKECRFHYRIQPRRKPKGKGGIERFLGVLNRERLQQQRGTTFSNILDRGDYDPAANAVITHAELLYVLHRELLDTQACVRHRGLRGIPAQVYAELTAKYPVDPVEDVQHLNMLVGHVDRRTLRRTGIEFEGIIYYSEEIVALLRHPKFLRSSPDRTVRFRYDPGDLREIRMHDPTTDKLIRVPPCERDADYATGLSIWQHRLIVKYRNERLKANSDYRGKAQAKVELAEFFEQAYLRRGKIRSRRTAARFAGVDRHALAGTDENTSPVGSRDRKLRDEAARANAARPARARVSAGVARPTEPSRSIPAPDITDEEEDLYAAHGISRSR
jgi:putative transposase